jgi:flagellar biosynthesis protein FliQ
MGAIVVYLCSGLCMMVYVPAVFLGIQEIFRQQATFDLRLKRLQFTGASAVFFGIGQTLGGLVAIVGVGLAIQNMNLLYIPLFVLFGGAVSMIGLWIARKTAKGEYEIDLMPKIDIAGMQVNFTNFTVPQAQDTQSDDVITVRAEDVMIIDSDDVDNPSSSSDITPRE